MILLSEFGNIVHIFKSQGFKIGCFSEMIMEEKKDQVPGLSCKPYSRSMSWTERSPRKTTSSKPQWKSKVRACLPPLQPLSIVRPTVEEWPRAGSDDLGVWPNPPTPGARSLSVTPRENSASDLPPREFEFRKDKLAFFNKACSRILDHIYLGSDSIAKDREILRENGITHVLNCVGFVCPEYFKNELMYKTLWLQDCPSEDITSILYDVFDYFEDVREQGGRVLVHCCQGVSRSTSLVIAYLMWKEGQSFDDAFQHVKSARGVTNPNVGFACQLLQCQKRVHALPASPTSVLRMYRMAPHSPYAPLHLVPKMLCEPGPDKLDSRGAFIVHIPSALYVWIGKSCPPVMSDNAMSAASQLIRYEKAKGPAVTVTEGEEISQFWDALSYRSLAVDGFPVKPEDGKSSSVGSVMIPTTTQPCLGQRKLSEYDLDFEIFDGALAGGVVPPCPLSEAGSETCLPAREAGWNRIRRKFASGAVKELITSSRSNMIREGLEKEDGTEEVECVVSPADVSMPSSGQCDSLDSLASYVTFSPSSKYNIEEDTSLSRSPSFSLVDSFSTFLVNKPRSRSTSPSLSPSTSDYSSSFTFSPSSSNWSDLSSVSTQPSPNGLESNDKDPGKSIFLEEILHSVAEGTCLPDDGILNQSEDARTTTLAAKTSGNNIPPHMSLPPTFKAPQILVPSMQCIEDYGTSDTEEIKCCSNFSIEMDGDELISTANSLVDDDEVLSRLKDKKKKSEPVDQEP